MAGVGLSKSEIVDAFLFDIRQARLGDGTDEAVEPRDIDPGKIVMDPGPLPARGDHAGLPEGLQVGGCGAQPQAGCGRQRLNGALPLGEQVQQFEAFSAAECLADAGKLLEQCRLLFTVTHFILQSSMEYYKQYSIVLWNNGLPAVRRIVPRRSACTCRH